MICPPVKNPSLQIYVPYEIPTIHGTNRALGGEQPEPSFVVYICFENSEIRTNVKTLEEIVRAGSKYVKEFNKSQPQVKGVKMNVVTQKFRDALLAVLGNTHAREELLYFGHTTGVWSPRMDITKARLIDVAEALNRYETKQAESQED